MLTNHFSVTINLSDVKKRWVEEEGPGHIRTILDHYNIFTDLFGTAFFYNTTPVSVCYDYDEEFVTPVHYGNRIPACEVPSPPLSLVAVCPLPLSLVAVYMLFCPP